MNSDQARGSGIGLQLDILRNLLGAEDFQALESALESVLDRVILGRILTDPSLAAVRELPDVYLASVDDMISEFLEKFGLNNYIQKDKRRKIRSLLLRGQAYGSRHAVIADATFVQVARSLLQRGIEDLRCRSCGYHFQYGDLRDRRRTIVKSLGMRLADSLHPMRKLDLIKRPIFTNLEVDHIIPRSGWGPTDSNNLQFLCQLCNQGKAIYSESLESISVFAAGSYSLHRNVDSGPNRTIFYSAIQYHESTCSRCLQDSDAVELTVIPITEWFVPWNVQVSCYECQADGVGDFGEND